MLHRVAIPNISTKSLIKTFVAELFFTSKDFSAEVFQGILPTFPEKLFSSWTPCSNFTDRKVICWTLGAEIHQSCNLIVFSPRKNEKFKS